MTGIAPAAQIQWAISGCRKPTQPPPRGAPQARQPIRRAGQKPIEGEVHREAFYSNGARMPGRHALGSSPLSSVLRAAARRRIGASRGGSGAGGLRFGRAPVDVRRSGQRMKSLSSKTIWRTPELSGGASVARPRADVAADGREGFEIAAHETFDVIFSTA